MPVAYHFIVADNQVDICTVITQVIRRIYPSAATSAVYDGVAALKLYEQKGADLLIIDIKMPGMSGLDLVQTLRSRQAALPIIIVSADARLARKAPAAGATHFLEKPFRVARLAQILTDLLSLQACARHSGRAS